MTIKQKFSSIDQSKLTADQKSFLDKIKNVTKNFTDAEMNKKVEQPLDNFIAKAKEKMPEAVKSAPVKKTAKAKSSQTRKPKRTAMSLAKEIRKEGESWNEARARASKMMKEDSKDLSKTVETELDKLSKLVKSAKTRSKLAGISGTDIKRDAVRKAKPRGARRVTHSGETSNQYGTFNNKLGRKYYESRDRHSDRLAPNYPKNAPLLENGAYLTDPNFGNFQNQVYAQGGVVRTFNDVLGETKIFKEEKVGKFTIGISSGFRDNRHVYIYEGGLGEYNGKSLPKNFRQSPQLSISEANDYYSHLKKKNEKMELGGEFMTDPNFGNFQNQVYARGGDIDAFTLRMVKSNGMQPAEVLKEDTNVKYSKGGATTNERKHVNHSEDYEVRYAKPRPSRKGYKGVRGFELGGNVVADLAGHTGGKLGTGDPSMLDGFSNTSYTGLVGETGAMSSGEMFMNGGGLPHGAEQSYMITEALGNPAQHFAKGGAVTNERKHVNHDEDYEVRYAKPRPSRKGYKGARKFMAGGSFANGGGVENKYNSMSKDDKEELMREKIGMGRTPFSEYEKYNQLSNYHKEEVNKHFNTKKFMAGGMNGETPRIYVADLEAYNSGRLVGEWLDLADYDNADELMDAIQNLLDSWGVEEYAIHDVEYVPRSMYSEYMGKRDFEQLYEMMDLAKQNDLPLEVVQEVVSQYSASAVEEFVGKYDSAVDFAEQLVDEIGGLENFSSPEYYVYITNTDRRLLAGEMADSYVQDIRDEDGGNRLIEEAGLNIDEYEDASDETKEEMLDLAQSMVSDEYYDTWYEGLNDPYYFLVEEQGMYSAEDFFNASFITVDYEKLGRDLDQDYTIIEYDGDVYVFNIR